MNKVSSDTLSVAHDEDSDVYISAALNTRPRRLVRERWTSAAMQELASAMVTAPAHMLPRLVELAMELTEADSAGLSLYESDPEPGVFRWKHLHGTLAQFDGATTPRNHSPCGVTLDRNEVTLSRHPERIYDWIASAGLEIPELLLVPLHMADEEPLGTLWVVAVDERQFDRGHAETLAELGRFAGLAIKMVRQEEELRAALDEQALLAKEMSHRIKNLFAMTEGMIHGSARNADTVDEFAEALSGRLHALSQAHSMVQRNVRAIGGDSQLDLAGLVATILKGHETGNGSPRITVAGAPVTCGAHAANSIALMLHELATNAAKYGALTTEAGSIGINWSREGDDFAIEWHERGGPALAGAPAKKGFGTALVTRTIEHQFEGTIEFTWATEGLSASIRIPEKNLAH